jgi:SAM-dependent methyltransferase
MSALTLIHGGLVHTRRVKVLGGHIASLLQPDARVLDVGCGDGLLARRIMEQRPDVTIHGVDVLVRGQTHIPVTEFDGLHIPAEDRSYDCVMFVDVLHHAADQMALLREARRITRRQILIKDHTREGLLAAPRLQFMDWVGNARHGVRLPYDYWPATRWREAFTELKLEAVSWNSRLGLYPGVANWLFERSLHFLADLQTRNSLP